VDPTESEAVARSKRAAAAHKYRPERIELLLVAEAPPSQSTATFTSRTSPRMIPCSERLSRSSLGVHRRARTKQSSSKH